MSLPSAYVTRYAALKTVNGSADSTTIAAAPVYARNSPLPPLVAYPRRRPTATMRPTMKEVTMMLKAKVDAVNAVTKRVAMPAK